MATRGFPSGYIPLVDPSPSLIWTRAIICALAVLALGAFAFLGSGVPVLRWADFGIHEFGHLIGYILRPPQVVIALLGNATQSGAPLALAGYFLFRRDLPAAGLCLGWCGTTLADASIYIADGPYQALPLAFEGTTHDWAYILGHWDALDQAERIADLVYAAGVGAVGLGVALCLAAPFVTRSLRV
jgi:hypothetical protein